MRTEATVTTSQPFETALAEGDDGTRLRVVVRRGDYTLVPFVLVHGLASNARLWDGVAEALGAIGHSSYAVDLRGHGESERPDDGYDFATVASDVAAVVRDVVERRAVLVGQSWGGNVVVEAAARYPEIAKAVACIDGGFIRLQEAFPGWEEAKQTLTPPSFQGIPADELRRGMERRLRGWPRQGIDGQWANFEQLADGTVRARLSLEHHLTILEHLWHHDPLEPASRVGVPLWVMATGEPTEHKRSSVDRFVAASSSGRAVWVDAHHDVHAQHPQLVTDFLLDLAEEVEA